MTMPFETLLGRFNGLRRWRGFAHLESALTPRGHISVGRRGTATPKDIVFYIELQRGKHGWDVTADLSRGDGHVIAETAWRVPGLRGGSADGEEPVLALSTGGGFGEPADFYDRGL
ncbi:hypothetical protein [Fodinicola acaciae]|uniref:hypothetical protein n=1 Tax=Fodinicola acaciae TaxID=2681555 RepID=UPI0013D3E9CF|nr:hypothetical protein [Fodinicola acaciae]